MKHEQKHAGCDYVISVMCIATRSNGHFRSALHQAAA